MDGMKIGIDFGNCNIKIANFNKKPKPLKIDNDENNRDGKIANVIKYKTKDDFIIGNKAFSDSKDGEIIQYIKRKLELEEFVHQFEGFALSAEEITRDIFSSINSQIVNKFGQASSTVITVPVCFTEMQKEKINVAALDAGIKVSQIISEPVAGLFSIDRIFEEECDETILIFDFGSSTLDLCVFEVTNSDDFVDINIISSIGLNFGGVDLTKMIYDDIICVKYKDIIEKELVAENETKIEFIQKELYKITDNLKHDLFESEDDDTVLILTSINTRDTHVIELLLDEVLDCFEKNNVKQKIIKVLNDLFSDIFKGDITTIKTFGGTSRILYIREILEEYFNLEIDDYDHDEAYQSIALGACKYADIISNKEENLNIDIKNSISFYAGINKNNMFFPIVQKNEKYNFFTPLKSLTKYLDNSTDYTISLYQSFECENINIGGENGAVFLGKINLDVVKYNVYKTENLLCCFGVNSNGKIVGQFSVLDDENEVVFIEEKEFIIGG